MPWWGWILAAPLLWLVVLCVYCVVVRIMRRKGGGFGVEDDAVIISVCLVCVAVWVAWQWSLGWPLGE